MNGPDEKDYRVFYEKYLPKKKKHNAATIFLGVFLLLILAGGSMYRLASFVAREQYRSGFDTLEEPEPDGGTEDALPDGTVKESADGYGEEKEGYVPTPQDDYYQELTDDPNTDLSYSIKWFDYSYEDGKNGVSLLAYYPEFSGKRIPNLTSLNETIRLASVQMMARYRERYAVPVAADTYYDALINGFVTYKSEGIASVVLWENIQKSDGYCQDLLSMNIDLVNGRIMDNGSIVRYDSALAGEFRKLDREQNGEDSSSAYLSDAELLSYLADSRCNIVFYTPVGLEIGYNYVLESGEFGYTTVTLKKYGKYVKQL